MAKAILPNWEQWAESGPALLSYRINQVLTGYGCFGEYLKRIGAEAKTACYHCNADLNSAQNTLEVCEPSRSSAAHSARLSNQICPRRLLLVHSSQATKKERRLPPYARR